MSKPAEDSLQSNRTIEFLYSQLNRFQTHWKWVGRILTGAAVLFAIIIFIRNWSELQQVNWRAYYIAVLISFLVYLASLLFQLFVWLRMLSVHHKVGVEDIKIYMNTVMLRQVPGGVWHWLGRTSMYKANTAVSSKPILLANFIDWCLILITAFGTYGLFATNHPLWLRFLLIFISLGFSIGAVYFWFPKQSWLYYAFEGTIWAVAYMGSWFMGGLLLFLLIRVEVTIPISLFEATAIWAIAGGISAIAIIAPSGLGIREISLVVLLQPYMPVAQSILLGLILRITFTASDIIWGASGWKMSQLIQSGAGMRNTHHN